MQNTTYAMGSDLRLYAAYVSSSMHYSSFPCVADAVPCVLCLCWLPISVMRHATRVISGLQILPSIVIGHLGGQTADYFARSPVLLDHEGSA